MNPIIEFHNVSYAYDGDKDSNSYAISNVNLQVNEGEFVAIIGHNGSGKSTLAKHMNAIFTPSNGDVFINGLNTNDSNNLWKIRQFVGMVFQNPDNQIVATNVVEDVAFGLENIGTPPDEIRERVEEALLMVNMKNYEKSAPHNLSGGQKQRVAIAGVIAMRPKCIVLDEATAMLDPIGRNEVISTVRRLSSQEKISVVHITHFMSEAVQADRVIVMDKGKIVMNGTPREIFAEPDILKQLRLDIPQVAELAKALMKEGVSFDKYPLTVNEMCNELCAVLDKTNKRS